MITVKTKMTLGEVYDFLKKLPGMLSGSSPDELGVAAPPLNAAMAEVLAHLEQDYRLKATGAQGEDGVTWQKLSERRLQERRAKRGMLDAGREQFPILIDEGRLLESVSAGNLVGSGLSTTYRPPLEQDVTVSPGSIAVQSTVPYAIEHQEGVPQSNLPSRPFMPEELPESWMEKATEKYAETLTRVIVDCLER